MLVGHVAVGLMAKRIEPRISLGTGILAALFADLAWCVFLIAGIEHVCILPAIGAAHYFDAVDIAWSHSLLMDIVWAGLFAAVYFARRHYGRGAAVLFAAVLSHWLLDFVSHGVDMPLAPGVNRYFGWGLWNSIPATIVVEGGFWLVAIILCARATHPKGLAGVWAFWIVIAFLTLTWYNNLAGPPPPNPRTMGIGSLIFFSTIVAWGYWMNRQRVLRARPRSWI